MKPFSYLVLGVTPTTNESNVSLDAVIRVSFAKHIETDTLNENTVRLRKVNGDFVSYTGRYFAQSKMYELRPNEPLLPGTQYQTIVMGDTTGVVSIDGQYLPLTKTYEFTTESRKSVAPVSNLLLSQDYAFIKASWGMPEGIMEGEDVVFHVKISMLMNAVETDIWPNNPLEGLTSATEITIPHRLESSQNYFVHVKADYKDGVTDWVTSQIYMEPIKPPSVSDEDFEDEEDDSWGTSFPALEVLDHFPASGAFATSNKVVVQYSGVSLVDLTPEELNSIMYVVEAPFRENLSYVDLNTEYSPDRAIPATITIREGRNSILTWTADDEEPFRSEREYTVVLFSSLEDAEDLYEPTTFHFTGRPTFFFATVSQVRDMVGEFGSIFKSGYLATLISRFSELAYGKWSRSATYDSSLLEDGEIPYFLNQYVAMQSAIDALVFLSMASVGGGRETISLDVLTITQVEASSSSVSDLLNLLRGSLKEWEDLVNGHTGRGYARSTVSIRAEAVEEYPDFLTRTTMADFGS